MPNEEMAAYWNDEGGRQWVKEQARYDSMLAPCGRRLLAAASLNLGERVLDVGCGNGATTLAAARHVGAGGHAMGIDLSVLMLEEASRRAREEGVDVEFLHADAQTATFLEPFDAIISRFGVMFFDDPPVAFANLFRALRPGGRLVFVCWRDMMNNEWMRVPAMAAVEFVGEPEPPSSGAPNLFSLADPAHVRDLLTTADLTDIRIDAMEDRLTLGRDVDDVVSFLETNSLGRRLFAEKEPALVNQALEAIRTVLLPYASSEGVALGSAYWVVSAVKYKWAVANSAPSW